MTLILLQPEVSNLYSIIYYLLIYLFRRRGIQFSGG